MKPRNKTRTKVGVTNFFLAQSSPPYLHWCGGFGGRNTNYRLTFNTQFFYYIRTMKEQVLILQEFFGHLAQFETELPTIDCYDIGSLIKSESTKSLTDKNTLEL